MRLKSIDLIHIFKQLMELWVLPISMVTNKAVCVAQPRCHSSNVDCYGTAVYFKLVPTVRLRTFLSWHEITVDLYSLATPCRSNTVVITCWSSDSPWFAVVDTVRATMVIYSNKTFAGEGSLQKGKSKFVNIKDKKTEKLDLRQEVQG